MWPKQETLVQPPQIIGFNPLQIFFLNVEFTCQEKKMCSDFRPASVTIISFSQDSISKLKFTILKERTKQNLKQFKRVTQGESRLKCIQNA